MAIKKTSKKRAKRRSKAATVQDEEAQALIVAGDDGNFYRLERSAWMSQGNRLTDPAQLGVVTRLRDLGTYLAAIPIDFAVGSGLECVLVNVEKIVSNKPTP